MIFWFVKYTLAFTCQVHIGTCQEHLPATEQRPQGCLPSASVETEPYAAEAANLQHPVRGIQRGEGGTPCSRETGGTGL